MGENTLALLRYLSAPGSPLPTLTEGYVRPTTVFFAHIGYFFIYSFTTAKIIYGALFLASLVFVKATFVNPAPALKKGRGVWGEQVRGIVAVVAGVIGSILVPNLVAVIMQRVLGKGMSWFAREYSALLLYGPAALLGVLLFFSIFLFTSLIISHTQAHFFLSTLSVPYRSRPCSPHSFSRNRVSRSSFRC